MTAHWGIADPAAMSGSEEQRQQAFRKAYSELDARIKTFTSLPLDRLDRLALQRALDAIGTSNAADADASMLKS
jgi:arsenate reductase